MADIFTKEKRSEVMSHIRFKNNKSTELKLIKIFKEYDITGWRSNYNVKGPSDCVFQQKRWRYLLINTSITNTIFET